MEKVIVLCVDWFYPAIQAGGPINSVKKISELLADKAKVYVLASNVDLDGSALVVDTRKWVEFDENIWVRYLTRLEQRPQNLTKIFMSLNLDVLYLNSLFSFRFSILPLLLSRTFFGGQVILAPRGMLGDGALSFKAQKKSLFLKLASSFGLFKNVRWHASTIMEQKEIEKFFSGAEIFVAKNIPNVTPKASLPFISKKAIQIIFSGRINRKKNIAFAISVLTKMNLDVDVHLTLAGQREDEEYALEIERLANKASKVKIEFVGVLDREDLFMKIRESHCFILPTLHENYGHSIVEAWANSCPVMISDRTPWKNLKLSGVGWDLPLNEGAWQEAFLELFSLNLIQRGHFSERCIGYFQEEVFTERDNDANLALFDL